MTGGALGLNLRKTIDTISSLSVRRYEKRSLSLISSPVFISIYFLYTNTSDSAISAIPFSIA